MTKEARARRHAKDVQRAKLEFVVWPYIAWGSGRWDFETHAIFFVRLIGMCWADARLRFPLNAPG